MNSLMADGVALYLGVDGGGSKCKALLGSSDHNLQGTGIAGPANPFQNLQQAQESVVQAATAALVDAGLDASMMDQLILGVGLAGVNIPRFHTLMQSWEHPFRALYLTTDIHVACLAAHGEEDGAVMVVGTGSVGYASAAGTGVSLGGHGFPFGDKGSGAWLGLEVVKAVLLAMDGLGPETSLVTAVERKLNVAAFDVIDAMAGARSRDYATFAPLVLQQANADDAVSQAIVRDGANYLNKMAIKLLAGNARRLCLLGGLSQLYTPWLSSEVRQHIVQPQGQPEEGALRYAKARHAAESTAKPAVAQPH